MSFARTYLFPRIISALRVSPANFEFLLRDPGGHIRAVVISHWSGSADNHVRRVRIREMTTSPSSCNFIPEASFRSDEERTLPYASDDSRGKFWKSVSSSWEQIVTYALPSKIRRRPDWPRCHKNEISRRRKNSMRLRHLRWFTICTETKSGFRQFKSKETRLHICCEKSLILRVSFFCPK